MKFFFVFLCIFLAFLSEGFGQKYSMVSVVLQVENSVYQQAVYWADISIEIREDFGSGGIYIEKIAKLKTDKLGFAKLDLLANKSYTCTIEKEGYIRQVLKINTPYFSEIQPIVYKISLRPQELLKVKGKVIIKNFEGLISGQIILINKATGFRSIQNISPDGHYQIEGIKGEEYDLKLIVDERLDTLLDIANLEQEVNQGELSLVLNIPLEEKIFHENENQKTYLKGDSLVLEKVKFIAKTTGIEDVKWLDTLAQKLLLNPALVIQLNIHTNTKKSHRFNRLLTERRVEILRQALLHRKIPKDQVELVARGEEPIFFYKKLQHNLSSDKVVLVVKAGEFLY